MMLVGAFAGVDMIRHAYDVAIREEYIASFRTVTLCSLLNEISRSENSWSGSKLLVVL